MHAAELPAAQRVAVQCTFSTHVAPWMATLGTLQSLKEHCLVPSDCTHAAAAAQVLQMLSLCNSVVANTKCRLHIMQIINKGWYIGMCFSQGKVWQLW